MNTKTETTTVGVTSDKRWAIAEFDEFAGGTIYVAYGELPDFERYTVERLGHFIDFETEQYPKTLDEVAEVLAHLVDETESIISTFLFPTP